MKTESRVEPKPENEKTAKTRRLKKETLRDLTVEQAKNIVGGVRRKQR